MDGRGWQGLSVAHWLELGNISAVPGPFPLSFPRQGAAKLRGAASPEQGCGKKRCWAELTPVRTRKGWSTGTAWYFPVS